MKIKLSKIAHARSGDKGNNCNIGVIAKSEKDYLFLVKNLTINLVKQHFKEFCKGRVERFEMPNIGAINFVLYDCLDGGGTTSLRTDTQGKTFAAALLQIEI